MTSRISADDLWLFNSGRHARLYEKLGAHPLGPGKGAAFSVFAPNARRVSVVGDFNGWDPLAQPLLPRGDSGIWEGIAAGAAPGDRYKFHLVSQVGGYTVEKADPYGFEHERPPRTASVVSELDYAWGDGDWMASRSRKNSLSSSISIYELHLGSWKRVPEENNRSLTYRELAAELPAYVVEMGFTHVEFLPVMEHPFDGSWGYQTTGYFAPTSRFGPPRDFMFLIDSLHRAGIGVILDWVPSHFPNDLHGLAFFDGTHLYEHADPRQGFHPDWKSCIFNYGRNEVRSFLLSSALFWLDRYHADGLRVDAVASMLYLDYSRAEGEWIPNEQGGRENTAAISLLKEINTEAYRAFPDVQMFAEESTAWAGVSRPVESGGLGFGFKWDMGWMHDTLSYFSRDPVHRKFHHDELTFRMLYAFSENFLLPLSHDEVVHGKGSLLNKMPGDEWQKFAEVRLLLAYQLAQPGKKLLFMGDELGGSREWDHDSSLDWHLLARPLSAGLRRCVADLNRLGSAEPALHELDGEPGGFSWIDCSDADSSTLALSRSARDPRESIVALFNFTPVPRGPVRFGVPRAAFWREVFNSDAEIYGGSGTGNLGGVQSRPVPAHGRPHSIELTLPPLAALFLKPQREIAP